MTTKKIYFVRHGETDANLLEYVPNEHEPLNVQGFRQADDCAKRVRTIDFERLYTSDYLRAQQTAKAIATSLGYTIETLPVFGEIAFPSALFGKPDTDEAVIQYRKDRNTNVEDPEWRLGDGENFTDLMNRIQKAKTVLEEDSAESILVVSHGIFMKFFAAAILLNSHEVTKSWFTSAQCLKISNTGITLFIIEDGVWRLIIWNDHAHFAE